MNNSKNNSNIFIFIDDIRSPDWVHWMKLPELEKNERWVVIRNYKDFINHIKKNGMPKVISFDHDLADFDKHGNEIHHNKEKTGYDCAKWLVEWCMDNNQLLPDYYVHSQNPVGSKNILGLLNNFKQFQNHYSEKSKKLHKTINKNSL